MSLTELMEVYLSDIGLFKEFLSMLICASCVATLMFVYLFRSFFEVLGKIIGKVERHIYLKRHGEAVYETIRSVHIVSQLSIDGLLKSGGLSHSQAWLIEDALRAYAKKMKYEI